MSGEISNVYDIGPKAGGKPESVVVLLHGLGSNGRDLISLAPYLAEKCPKTVFVSPDAPFACDMVPPGYPDSYQWFSLQSRDPEFVLEGIEKAFPILEAFLLETMEKYGVGADKLALVGFSQGTMMSLYTAPRMDKDVAGVVGYSGALFGGEGLLEDPDEFQKFPICLIHGEADDVVSVSSRKAAEETLTKAGYEVSGHTTPGLTHSIDERGIEEGAAFLAKVLG